MKTMQDRQRPVKIALIWEESWKSWRLNCHFWLNKKVTLKKIGVSWKPKYKNWKKDSLHAIIESPFSQSSGCSIPHLETISLSDSDPGYNWLTKVIAPEGLMPTKALYVTWCLPSPNNHARCFCPNPQLNHTKNINNCSITSNLGLTPGLLPSVNLHSSGSSDPFFEGS